MTEAFARRFIYRWTEEASGSCTTPKVGQIGTSLYNANLATGATIDKRDEKSLCRTLVYSHFDGNLLQGR